MISNYRAFLGERNPEKFNKQLLETKSNDDLINHIDAICKALTVIPNIEYLGANVTSNRRIYKNTKTEKGIDMKDSILDVIKMKFKLTKGDEQEEIEKELFFPRLIDGQYFIINGNKYFPVFQMVDAGTYRNKDSLTLKTLLMPIKIRDISAKISDTEGNEYSGHTYTLDMFKNKLNIFLYYLAKWEIRDVIDYFKFPMRISDNTNDVNSETEVAFGINKNTYFIVDRTFMSNEDNKNLIITFISNFNIRSKIDDQEYWQRKLGSNFTKNNSQQLEKALGIMLSFERVLDETTKKILRTEESNKQDIYTIIRWMTQNYSLLSKQDTLDLDNKRLRLYEYILNPLLLRFSKSTYRILNSRQVTMHTLKTVFSNLQKGTLVKELVKNELVRYKNSVNCYDLFTVYLKGTQSGPQTSFSSGNVNVKFRDIHLSMVDRIDLASTSNGDPGTNFSITPFCQLHENMHFSKEATYMQGREE